MRAQLSLELLVYLSLAGLSFLFAISAANRASASTAISVQRFEISQFANSVGGEVAAGSAASFSAFVPKGLCNATLGEGALITSVGTFYLPMRIYAPEGTFCPDGTYARLEVSYEEGEAALNRVG
jgi:hypothetical protein